VALDQTTGNVLWTIPAQTFGFIFGTPTISGNVMYVPVYSPPGVVALDVTTGSIIWRRASSDWGGVGNVRTEPLVANGMVYVGTASGDPISGCHNGTVAALDSLTGSIVWSFKTAIPGQGVAVWSPIAMSPLGDVVFGTGNGCGNGLQHVESEVALNATTGVFHWQATTSQQGGDSDIGSGLAEAGGRGFFTGKDGQLYAIELNTGDQLWTKPLGSLTDHGSIATPATDGSNVVTQTGALNDPDTTSAPQSRLVNYGIDGTFRWSVGPFVQQQFSSPVITNDVVISGIDNGLELRSLQTGAPVWSYDLGSFVYSSPAVVGNAIYIASYGNSTVGGTVAAFTVGGSTTHAKRYASVQARRKLREFHPWKGRAEP
jgi:outer membrane protein assembly factor BamB